ncbi:DUF4365 domain-containing protein [Leptospira meyeri]|uniref:DUF4365 domain-containing protein n=1 Tax=Leptospira meyeri TaxID=29508 RepID=UPI00108313CC|nr:DUF4365 domain-containing protein [Leptospira meyeri]TGM62987.1 DUF4365 domain-containing protein [Leptospira meyeri]TGM68620.1 DUF4365 domain-containing protein [Leptospira meyeri]
MFTNSKKELFSIAFIQSLTAPLGFNPSTPKIDNDSVDIEFTANDIPGGIIRDPSLRFQLKCTKKIPSVDDYLHFALPIKNYKDLRGSDFLCPRYLIVITTPENANDWINATDSNLILKYCGYYYSLKDEPESDNKDSVTLRIPKTNLLTPEILFEMMLLASKGLWL